MSINNKSNKKKKKKKTNKTSVMVDLISFPCIYIYIYMHTYVYIISTLAAVRKGLSRRMKDRVELALQQRQNTTVHMRTVAVVLRLNRTTY